jgi:Zn-finger nucleic acid-binding protein
MRRRGRSDRSQPTPRHALSRTAPHRTAPHRTEELPVNCPIDGTVLQLAERHGIEIDYCPVCRGVWLDRGELDKIIERADDRRAEGNASRSDADWERFEHDDRSRRYDDPRLERVAHGEGRRKRKRGSFLSDLFEFGD